VVSWALAGESGSGLNGVSDHLQIDISVQFEKSLDGVSGGDLLIYSASESRGGIVHYDKERRFHGCLWLDVVNTQVLATLLASGKAIVLCLTGRPFHRRQMFVDRVYWYTKGHPGLEPDLRAQSEEGGPRNPPA
jgi:hypothetical protein